MGGDDNNAGKSKSVIDATPASLSAVITPINQRMSADMVCKVFWDHETHTSIQVCKGAKSRLPNPNPVYNFNSPSIKTLVPDVSGLFNV